MTKTPTTVGNSPSALRAGLDAVYMVAAVMGATCVVLICALMVFQSLGREFGLNTGATNDIVSWLCAAAAFLTMAHAFKHGDFVRVTLVLEKVSAKTRRLMHLTRLARMPCCSKPLLPRRVAGKAAKRTMLTI